MNGRLALFFFLFGPPSIVLAHHGHSDRTYEIREAAGALFPFGTPPDLTEAGYRLRVRSRDP